MHDIKALRESPDAFVKGWSQRGMSDASELVSKIQDLDARFRAAQTAQQEALAQRNAASKAIGAAKAQKDEAKAASLMAEVETYKTLIAEKTEEERVLGEALKSYLVSLPNLPFEDVPLGPDETGNVKVKDWGTPPALGFAPKDHADLGEALGMMDFEAAAKMSGARFVVLKGQLAKLERALGQFMLDVQTTEHGYEETNPPVLVRDTALFGTGQLPKFEEDLFKTTDDRYLIPTSEVTLTNLVREQILDEDTLPKRFTALTLCFRAEAGSAGRDTKGMIRQHQFQKVEMVSITAPEQSEAEHLRMTRCAETILEKLGLAYRTMLLCTGDMGFGAKKTFDLEVWLPSQNTYREISSCSNCGDFQARRMDARARKAGDKATRFVHTLNGSGLAVGRTLVAVMENYQREDGKIVVPQVLRPYMGGLELIG